MTLYIISITFFFGSLLSDCLKFCSAAAGSCLQMSSSIDFNAIIRCVKSTWTARRNGIIMHRIYILARNVCHVISILCYSSDSIVLPIFMNEIMCYHNFTVPYLLRYTDTSRRTCNLRDFHLFGDLLVRSAYLVSELRVLRQETLPLPLTVQWNGTWLVSRRQVLQ